jgi:hypothetical protein
MGKLPRCPLADRGERLVERPCSMRKMHRPAAPAVDFQLLLSKVDEGRGRGHEASEGL